MAFRSAKRCWQKQRWLPGLASGETGLGALALTERGAGSDLNSGQTRAERTGDEWVIRGSKARITNVAESSIVTTLCRTRPDAGSHSFSLIVVPVASPGLHVGPPEKKMGVRASPTYAINYDDVHVPADHVLGEPGQGLPQTLKVLDGGRISIGALSVGLARASHQESIRYGSEGRSFSRGRESSHRAPLGLQPCESRFAAFAKLEILPSTT